MEVDQERESEIKTCVVGRIAVSCLWCSGLGDTNDGFCKTPIFVSAERRRVRCDTCGCCMTLRAVVVGAYAVSRIIKGFVRAGRLGVSPP